MRVKRIFVVHAPHKVGSAPRIKVSERVGGISPYSGPRGVASFISGEENERPQTSGADSAMHELIFCSKVLELTVRKFCHIKFAAWNRWCHVRQIVTIYEYSRSCLADVFKAYLDHSAVFRMALGRWTGPRFSRANLNTVRNNCRWLTFSNHGPFTQTHLSQLTSSDVRLRLGNIGLRSHDCGLSAIDAQCATEHPQSQPR